MSELRSSLHPVTREELVAEIVDLRQRLDAAEKDAARYATARLMNPQQWKDAYALNISTGKPFDEIIDDLRPFYRTAAMQEK